jgi:predicted acetyltransferase
MATTLTTEKRALELREPAEELRKAYLDYLEDFRQAGESPRPSGVADSQSDYDEFVRRCRQIAAGVNLPEGYVPKTQFWLVQEGRILGTARLRHGLTRSLADFGGHIGYEIRPSERGKGYATRLLSLVLAHARQMGLTRVLITCDVANIASARVIQKNGGVLASESFSPAGGRVIQRYWIELEDEP